MREHETTKDNTREHERTRENTREHERARESTRAQNGNPCGAQNKFAPGQVDPSHFRNVLLNAEVVMIV